jgi:hypothetical protein
MSSQRASRCARMGPTLRPNRRKFYNLIAVLIVATTTFIAICHLPRFPGARIVRSDPLCYPQFDDVRKCGSVPPLSYQKVNGDG